MENNLIGKKFGFWMVESFYKKSQTGHKYWNCVCKCGVKKQIREYPLLRSQTKSCGCISRALCYARNFRHGHARTYNHGPSATYQCWLSMRSRCLNPTHKAYSYYGGRGINVCDRWMKFENFFDDMGEKPNGLSLDRINNDLGYFKENCRWATDNEQGENRRNTRRIFHNGALMTLRELSDLTGICRETIVSRIYQRKMSVVEALSRPVMDMGQKSRAGRGHR